MRPLLIGLAVMLGGCGMSNEEIIAERKKCQDAGMDYEIQHNMDGQVIRVVCTKP